LFINKVDRLITELKLTPEQVQQRFFNIITRVNGLIRQIAEPDFKEKFQVDVTNGSVAFGSARDKWALSLPYMQQHNITFKDVVDTYLAEDDEKVKELAKRAPLYKVVLAVSIKHHPNPVQAQKYRIPKIWHGDLESEAGKALLSCDPNGPVVFVCTSIVVDKHAGEIAAGRLFSGTIKQGQDLNLLMGKQAVRIQQVSIYIGPRREIVDEAPAGNIIGIAGLKGAFSGETVSSIADMEPFEGIKHLFEPVITKAIEAVKPSDLPKLVEVLRQVTKEDPTIVIQINESTGEHLMSGMGELHLEVIENRIKSEKGVDVRTSEPIVVYRETVTKKSPEAEGKSPNKHNKFYISVEPLEEPIYQLMKSGQIPDMKIRKKEMEIWEKLEAAGMDSKIARRIKEIYSGNMIIDMTRGIVNINEVMELVLDAFRDVMALGPIAREPCNRVKVIINDMKLHEDAIHRGPAQVLPAVRDAMRLAMLNAGLSLLEPVQTLQIEAPSRYMGDLSKLVQNRRGQLLDMQQEGDLAVVKAKLPVAEMFGLSSDLRGSTEGRGNFYVQDQSFEKMPYEQQGKVSAKLRERKGLKLVDGVAMQA
ncbi:MAG: elongation factor EF-2, partial [Candidatus Woesearchaeota archaeon]